MKATPTGGNIAIYDIADGIGEYEDVTLLLMQKPIFGRKLKHMVLADTKNKYEDMSALEALDFARERNLLLPDIQREYVWDVSEIEALFESIVDNYLEIKTKNE